MADVRKVEQRLSLCQNPLALRISLLLCRCSLLTPEGVVKTLRLVSDRPPALTGCPVGKSRFRDLAKIIVQAMVDAVRVSKSRKLSGTNGLTRPSSNTRYRNPSLLFSRGRRRSSESPLDPEAQKELLKTAPIVRI
jgi:hypothetical protein